jgi:uncharacterized OsmC-like protein
MEGEFNVRLTHVDEYAFDVDFGDPSVPTLRVDEPAPLGGGTGPNAVRLLGAAVAECLASSLIFCLRRARIDVQGMRVEATVRKHRNDAGRLRVAGIDVRLHPVLAAGDAPRSLRCLGLFEEFCTVSASLREAFPINVEVVGAGAAELLEPA